MKSFFTITLAIVGLTSSTVFAGGCNSSKSAQKASYNYKADIVDTALAAGSFTTLTKALGAAGLVDALKGHGPFTVFAPTDEAFAKLPSRTLQTLLRPENRDQLVSILTYHVAKGRLDAGKVTSRSSTISLNGQRLTFKTDSQGVRVDKASVVKADIQCSNGIIHVIDTVMLPADNNIVDTAKNAGTFNTLLAAAGAANLDGVLSGHGPFTVFAPTDEAFAKLPKSALNDLLKPQNRDKLERILKNHVIKGRVFADAAVKAQSAHTVSGDDLGFRIDNGRLTVNDANVLATDVQASNGVIHVIDSVLLPQ